MCSVKRATLSVLLLICHIFLLLLLSTDQVKLFLILILSMTPFWGKGEKCIYKAVALDCHPHFCLLAKNREFLLKCHSEMQINMFKALERQIYLQEFNMNDTS